MTVNFDIESDIRAAKGGDKAAFGRLVRVHEKMLMVFAAYRVPVRDEAREAVQDTFLRAYEQLADFREGSDFGVWLRSICRYMILSRVNEYTRRRLKHEKYCDQLSVLAVQTISAGAPADYVADPLHQLSVCMRDLRASHRDLLADRYDNSLSVQEISEKTGRTTTWVTSTLHRVRSVLRSCIEKNLKEKSHE